MSSQNRSNNRSGNNQQRRNNNSNSHRRGVPQRKNKPAQPKLSWWQKLLSKLGLYTPPAASGKTPAKRSQGGQQQIQRSNSSNKPTAKKAAKKRAPKQAPPQKVDSARLYVGNLSYDVGEQDLVELFKGFGGVKSAEVVYNKRTQRSKGFAFVQMGSVDDAKRAVEVLHEQPFMGRNMIVNGARSVSEEREAIENPAA